MSTLVIDTIQGKTTAGSVNVRGEGSNNTNLQQGLAKQWVNLNGSGTAAVTDSFNNSSMTDTTTGNYTTNITSNMSNTTYAVPTGGAYDEDNASAYALQGCASLGKTTSSYVMHCGSNTTAAMDWEYVVGSILGDLS
tara:strand:- start:43 stop:453 length:411 start_codon:yes stop_codon:yes gene_type:complete